MRVGRWSYWRLLKVLVYLLFYGLWFFLVLDLDWRRGLSVWQASPQIMSEDVLLFGLVYSLIKYGTSFVV